ncbi:MAG: hypothetical protein DIKNOCCD_01122 [bacterium]|nr:hypothetical protein [bacterium]
MQGRPGCENRSLDQSGIPGAHVCVDAIIKQSQGMKKKPGDSRRRSPQQPQPQPVKAFKGDALQQQPDNFQDSGVKTGNGRKQSGEQRGIHIDGEICKKNFLVLIRQGVRILTGTDGTRRLEVSLQIPLGLKAVVMNIKNQRHPPDEREGGLKFSLIHIA